MATSVGTERRQAMTEAGWIIRDAVARATIEYKLTIAELTAIIAEELSAVVGHVLLKTWDEEDAADGGDR